MDKNMVEYTVKHKLPITLMIFLYLCLGIIIYTIKENVILVNVNNPVVIELQHQVGDIK